MYQLLDVIQLCKRFGTYIYTGNQEHDCELLLMELKELHTQGLIIQEDYIQATLVVRQEQLKRKK